MLLLVAIYYFFAIIGMEAFRFEVYPQCWYDMIMCIFSLVPRPETARRKGPGFHCLRMR